MTEQRLTLTYEGRGFTYTSNIEFPLIGDFAMTVSKVLPVLQAAFPWLVAKVDQKGRIYFDVEEPRAPIQPYMPEEMPKEVVKAEEKLYEPKNKCEFSAGDMVHYFGDDVDRDGVDIFGAKGDVVEVDLNQPYDAHRILVYFYEGVRGHGDAENEWWCRDSDIGHMIYS